MNLPNRLSLFRLVLIPIIVLVWLLPYTQLGIDMPTYYVGAVALPLKNIIACVIFAIASITDFLDGYIARSTHQVTTFGKFVDPIADKCLTTTLFILFVYDSIIPCVPVVIMVLRDIIVDAIRFMAAEKNKVMAAGMMGKIKTTAQMFCIIFILLNNIPFELAGLPIADILLWMSMFFSIFSGISYFNQAKDIILATK